MVDSRVTLIEMVVSIEELRMTAMNLRKEGLNSQQIAVMRNSSILTTISINVTRESTINQTFHENNQCFADCHTKH